jgi:pSer/pThr/pTyr-binding forkhead associated (FHA) protein
MMRVFVTTGKDIDKSFDFNSDVISVGRSPENDIQLKDQFVSRNHIKIFRKDDRWFLEDLNSRNGTFVNGERITPGAQFEVPEGLSIVVGMSVLSLGKGFSDRILTVLGTPVLPTPRKDAARRPHVERKMTAQKNMELVYKVYRVLMESLGIEEKLEKTLNFIFDLLLRIDRGAIILLDSETGELKKVAAKSKQGTDDVQYSKAVVDWVLRHKEAFMVSDPDVGGEKMPETLKLMNIKSVMCVPLISKSRLRGVLYLDSVSRPYGFRGEDVYLMRALSSPIAAAIENALLKGKDKPSKRASRPKDTAQGCET